MTLPETPILAITRRNFLRQMGSAPFLYLAAPLSMGAPGLGWNQARALRTGSAFSESSFLPHYPERSPLESVLRFAEPGSDEYALEGYAAQIAERMQEWSLELRQRSAVVAILSTLVEPSIQTDALMVIREKALRPSDGIEAVQREFAAEILRDKESFLSGVKTYLAPLAAIEVADFEIFDISRLTETPLVVAARIRYELVGTRRDGKREQRAGVWQTRWRRTHDTWRAVAWTASTEVVTRAMGRFFLDVTTHALGKTDSYRQQLRHGADYWRTVLDGSSGIDVYGNTGVAVGDFDNDGFDDVYICQPSGLPNRLYRNRGDGTFEDVTRAAGVDVLDFTACAIFADFENRGHQDLLVVTATGPLLFRNNGNGTFLKKADAFQFARPPQGAFTHAAVADYDHDGRLDIYFCLYSYYQGLDQYHYPVPYFDARNGPPNYLFHNQGDGIFVDRTDAAGLHIENDRYSFACSWGDSTGDGWPDLYVVNDFGRNSLYRNNRNGTFTAVSSAAHVDEAGAGMSACWLDFDNDGKQDIYAAGMWVAAGMRVFGDPHFHTDEAESIRTLYRRHMAGNSLYQNLGDGTFHNVGVSARVDMGRWSWSTDAWDFDHDGHPDLYVTNGYISGLAKRDVSSFFWRQVVAKSPADASPSPDYERGWGAMNELIRSDSTWNGRERNCFFVNNGDGTFTDVSGVVGMDFRDDSRAFGLADLDGDGRLEVVLKNRNAPQVRILRFSADKIGNCVAFRLRGTKSNRDAIGASVTLEAGNLRQTKTVQAGSGFLSQHTKELFFGVGSYSGLAHATVRWPNGMTQDFDGIPLNRRVSIVEGAESYSAVEFAKAPEAWTEPGDIQSSERVPDSIGSWLIEPVKAPEFSLADVAGNLRELREFAGKPCFLMFATIDSDNSRDQLIEVGKFWKELSANELQVVCVSADGDSQPGAIREFVNQNRILFPVLFGTGDLLGIYNLLYRYLFDRHRDLSFPTSFLIDSAGAIVKVYQGQFAVAELRADAKEMPRTPAQRVQMALPFEGTLHQESFRRNAFTFGVAFFQHGFLDQAAEAFQQAVAANPEDAEAYYNLGTLYLRRKSIAEAKKYLERTVALRPDHPEAWNNLGMLAAEQGDGEEAKRDFEQSIRLRPKYATALLNLGNLYRRQNKLDEAESALKRAFESEPNNPEVSYGLGMLYTRRDQVEPAEHYLQNALVLRPGYADALNNLGVLFVQRGRYEEAESKFKECIARAPNFDQAYLNLSRLYVAMDQKDKARTALQSLLERQPDHKMARQMLQLLY